MTTVRTLLAVAAVSQWPLLQMDVKNVFLNGDLSDIIYMQPPPGLRTPPQHVCRLCRAIYGLKQAPWAWFEHFCQVVTQAGFTGSSQDHSLFVQSSPQGRAILLLHVDDMIITGDDIAAIQYLQRHLQSQFRMKDLGSLRYFLGIEITRSDHGILLSQQKYLSDILSRAALVDTRNVDTPLELNVKLRPTDGQLLPDPTRDRQIVGQFVYLCITRLDIVHAVSIVSQFMSAPSSIHYGALLRILRYLSGTMTRSLYLSSSSPLTLQAYSDADWADDPTSRRSITGYCVFLGDSLISWRSKKQNVVSLSSTEAEYRAMATTAKEIVHLRRLLSHLGVHISGSTPMHCDNRSAIHIASIPVFHERTKHIEIDCHFVREQFLSDVLSLPFTYSTAQLADFFTKSHTVSRHQLLIGKLSAFDPP
ncbi:uncharacterized mitochondrial protein AtMg00810-like [Tripterygium wilfordii]|uniref:uncharacterized mitochondrial protein AtMg00810-like n=1 Tax=Tripterygium wilfordii TaxID=458696 RepID=UPI0018F858D6|nr:uncharacterized mitochondrial protein AtMg00810-like [Tripterygium wilfordii]